MNSFDILVNKAFNLNKVDEAIIVTKNQYKNYFQAISKHFGGNGTYHVEKFGEVSMPTPKGTITFYFDTHEENENILVLTAVKVGDKKENISLNLTSIKDITLLNNLDNEVDRLFNKPKEKVKSTFVAPTFSVEKVEKDFSIPAKAVKISNPDKFVANIQTVWGISHDSDVDIDEGNDGTCVITFDNLDHALKFASIVIIIKHFCLVAAYGWTQDSHEKEIIDVEHVSSPTEFVKSLELKDNSKRDISKTTAFTDGIPPKGALEVKNYKDFAAQIAKYKFPGIETETSILYSLSEENIVKIVVEANEEHDYDFYSVIAYIVDNKLTLVSSGTAGGEGYVWFSTVGNNIVSWIKNTLWSPNYRLFSANSGSVKSYFDNLIFSQLFAPVSKSKSSNKKYKPKDRVELQILCNDFSINLGDIDTSLITDMSSLFCDTLRTNEQFKGIETWDVSNVTNMYQMFQNAEFFNQSLNSWNVSNVENMKAMFYGAKSFNQPLNKWNVSNVEDMKGMFRDATSFNQPLNSWNVGKVKYMSSMFSRAESFNQPLDKWDVSNVKNMNFMFWGAKSFNQDLSSWDVSNVVGWKSHTFSDCLIKAKYKPKFKNNESYKGVTMSNTIFGKMLERAFTQQDWRKYPGAEKIEGKYDPIFQKTIDGTDTVIMLDGTSFSIFPDKTIDDTQAVCYSFLSLFKKVNKIESTKDAIEKLDLMMKDIKSRKDIKSFMKNTGLSLSVLKVSAGDYDDLDEPSKEFLDFWKREVE